MSALSERGGENEIATRKAELRAALLRELRAMTTEDRGARSAMICRRILDSQQWRIAERVVLFSPLRSEPDISSLASVAAAAGKLVLIIPPSLRDEAQLELNFKPDFVLVPGLAFSRDGHRLGRGAGFYDRLLSGRSRDAFKMGVCFSFQLRETIPRESHDAVLDAITTEAVEGDALSSPN